eukprot:5818541-Pleurochrysis_carterae.AAC.1
MLEHFSSFCVVTLRVRTCVCVRADLRRMWEGARANAWAVVTCARIRVCLAIRFQGWERGRDTVEDGAMQRQSNSLLQLARFPHPLSPSIYASCPPTLTTLRYCCLFSEVRPLHATLAVLSVFPAEKRIKEKSVAAMARARADASISSDVQLQLPDELTQQPVTLRVQATQDLTRCTFRCGFT